MSWNSAPFPSQRWVYALGALITVTAGPLHAQETPKKDRSDDPNAPVVVKAEEISGRPDREVQLTRDAEVTKGATRMTADSACYDAVEDQVSARGNVKLWRFGDRYQGDALQLNLDSGLGWILHPQYRMQLNNGQGKANRVDFLSQDEALVVDGTYSTCEGPNPDWYLKADTLRLDAGRDVGRGGKTVVYFKGVPIIGTPAMSFSLSGARRSGWLPPSIGFGSKGSAEVMVPYYFNIAPNRDLTVYPRMIFARGLQMGATARYMGETDAGPYAGETRAELLLHDRVTNTNRWLLNSLHTQTVAPDWSYGWNVRAVSDNQYSSDFSQSISSTAERQLMRELRTDYQTQNWSVTARVQNYQVLQDPAAATNPSLTVPRPYARLPQIKVHTGRYDVGGGFDWSVDTEVTRFWHPDLVSGNRAVIAPQLSYPFVRPGYFITPKVMVNASKYQLDAATTSAGTIGPTSLTRVLPTFSLDSGLIFERQSTLFGRAITQTLEPRLYYVRTPYKDQSQFPIFDTAVADFNFAQIFTENRFIGSDRISDANQVTAAVTSRYLESDGAERLRLTLGQRFYFSQQRVQLDPTAPLNQSRSDVLVAASGRVAENWSFDSAVQYNASTRSVSMSNYGVQWLAGDKKVVNAEYRYQRASFKNVDLSGQWPLSLRWYGVARVSYSLMDRKILDSLVGLEYKADCWVFRMGAQRFVTAFQTTSTPVFFQLELNGLSKLGFGNPLQTFSSSIPGYSRLNPVIGR